MSDHEVLDRDDWAIARKIFLARQARFTRSGERCNAELRQLPLMGDPQHLRDTGPNDLPFDMHQ